MKLICFFTIVLLFMYQIWKGCCAPSWNNGPISFGNRLERLFPGPARRTTSQKSHSGPAPGPWIYIMGHHKNKRSETIAALPDIINEDALDNSPSWNDRAQTLRILNNLLHYLKARDLAGHLSDGINDLNEGKVGKEYATQ